MFGSVDRSVIAMVLESNGGHMERTVEQLLVMDDPSAASDMSPPQVGPGPAAGELPGPGRGNAGRLHQGAGGGGGAVMRDGPPALERKHSSEFGLDISRPLPEDFLRPPSYFQKQQESQVDEDAILAQMLQDREFLRDLRRNPQEYGMRYHPRQQPIMPQIPGIYPFQAQHVHPQPAPVQHQVPAQPAPADNAGADDGVGHVEAPPAEESSSFRTKWAALSASAKRKFAALANRLRNTDKKKPPPSEDDRHPALEMESSSYMALPSLDDDGGQFELVADDDDDDFDLDEDDQLQDRRFARQISEDSDGEDNALLSG